MSQAEEMVRGMNVYPTSADEDEHIVINADRSVTVPESLREIAVQFDHNVERVTFDCPRYWDDVDLSQMHIFINYMLSDGYMNRIKVENVVVDETDESMMHFDWVISGNVTRVNGMVTFIVCAKDSDIEGNVKLHWNSKLCNDVFVSEGLDCGDSIVTQNADIIEQLLVRMATVEEGAPRSVETTKTDYGHKIIIVYADGREESFDVLDSQIGIVRLI